MVRTQGGYRFRPRVRFSTPEMDDPGTSAAAGVHSPGLHRNTQPAVAPATVPLEPQGFRRYQTRVRPQTPSLVPQRRRRRARPPSGPGHQARGSPRCLGPSYNLPELRTAHRPIYPQPRGLGGHCSLGPRFRGT